MMFRAFRLVVGLILGVFAIWTMVGGATELASGLEGGVETATLVLSALKVLAGLVVHWV